MAIEAYAVSVAAKLEDGVSSGLLRIVANLDRANTGMLEFASNVRAVSRMGLTIGRNLEKAAAGATALGDSASGLTRASYVLDTMAASSADVARNLGAAKAASLGLGKIPGAGAPSIPGTGGGSRATEGSRGGGDFGKNAAAATGISIAYGLYENARLQDTNIKAAATSQIAIPLWIKTADELRKQEFAYARKFAFATGGKVAPFGAAMLESSRLLRTLSPDQQRVMTDTAMPYAAVEAKLKGIPLPEAMQAFIGLAHQAGAYSPQAAAPLFESMMQASLTTHASLNQIARAASYALPALHAAGANSSDVMMMIATMMQAGILNTKSGTWLNAMAMNALPNTLGSGLFKNKLQNEALENLGLYKNGKSQFYKNGQFNLMSEVAILAGAREHMDALKFNAALRQAFGVQGQRAGALFSEPQVLSNLSALRALTNQAQAPIDIAAAIKTLSTIGQADQTIANANMTLMNATGTFMGPANAALDKAGTFFGWTADYTKKHPLIGGALDIGAAIGTAAILGKTWTGAKLAVDMVGSKVFAPLTKGILGMAKYIMTNPYAMALLGGVAVGTGINYLIDKHLTEENGGKPTTLGGLYYDRLHHADGSFNWGGIFTLHGETQAEANKRLAKEALSVIPPTQTQQTIQVHTKINLDGRKVGEAVTEHQAHEASRPFAGATGFDWNMGLAPVALGGGF